MIILFLKGNFVSFFFLVGVIRNDTDIHDAVKLCVDNNLNGLVFVKIYDLEWKIKKDDTFNYSNIRRNQL